MGKKRYRIHWGRVTVFLLAVAAFLACMYYAIAAIVSLFTGGSTTDGSEEKDSTEVVNITQQSLAETKQMSQRLDSLMHIPMRLDTSKIAICVYDLTTHQQVYALHEQQLLPPASCMKIATAITAVKKLGLDYRYNESLLVKGQLKRDTLCGNLLLMADDDPLCETFDGLAKQMRNRGIRYVRGKLYLTLAREDTLGSHPSTKTWDIPYHKTPLLMRGRKYIERNLLATLRMNGITFKADNSVRPEGKYHYVASESHSLRNVITPMMIHSSNIKAEAVLYHVDYKTGVIRDHRSHWDIEHASERFLRQVFDKDSTHVMDGFVINDGSGLSPLNRMTASFLVDMLKYAYADRQMRDYFMKEALASPDDGVRRGSLLSRMQQPEYRGRIFCKTGTVVTIGASSLAGYLHGRDDHWYVFSIINTESPVAESRIFQDRLCKLMMSSRRVR